MRSTRKKRPFLGIEYQSKSEKEFCLRWVFTRHVEIITSGLWIGVVLNSLTIGAVHYFANQDISELILPLHVGFLLGKLFALVFQRKPELFLMITSVVTITFISFYHLSMYSVLALGDPAHHTAVWMGLVALSIFAIQFLPTIGMFSVFQAVVYGLANYYTLYDQPHGYVNAGVFSSILLFTCLLKQKTYMSSIKKALVEYRFRSMIAPAHIVRRAARRGESLKETFATEEQFCACISSDWRNYQKLSKSISAKHLAAALEGYYALCNKLLERVMPKGNYFVDWIADELFVVIFKTKHIDEQEVIHSALTFATKLIYAKEKFFEKYKLPENIDVGVSCGDAIIGLMGPKAHKKATALGDVPGTARRIQNFGKILKQKFGKTDRIIFDKAVFALAPANIKGIRTYAMSDPDEIRDVKCDYVFFLDPLLSKPKNKKNVSNHNPDQEELSDERPRKIKSIAI